MEDKMAARALGTLGIMGDTPLRPSVDSYALRAFVFVLIERK